VHLWRSSPFLQCLLKGVSPGPCMGYCECVQEVEGEVLCAYEREGALLPGSGEALSINMLVMDLNDITIERLCDCLVCLFIM